MKDRVHRYRVTRIKRVDFGETRQPPVEVTAQLAVVPDGTPWAQRSPMLELGIEEGELAHGDVVEFSLKLISRGVA